MATHDRNVSEDDDYYTRAEEEAFEIVSNCYPDMLKEVEYDPTVEDEVVYRIKKHFDLYRHSLSCKPIFLHAMKTIPTGKTSIVGRILVLLCSNADRDSCGPYVRSIEALLEGETGHSVDVNYLSPTSGVPALYAASSGGNVRIVKLLLDHGADPYLVAVKPDPGFFFRDLYCYGTAPGKIPLDIALCWSGLRDYDKEFPWTSDQAIDKLLAHICKRENTLETIQLLTSKMDDIGQTLYRCIKEREVYNIAALLLIARGKVMSSTILESKEGSSLDAGMNIFDFIKTEIAAMGDEDFQLLGHHTYSEKGVHRRKLMFALLLIEMFEEAGDNLDRCVDSNRGKVVAEEVVSILKADSKFKKSWEIVQAKSNVKERTFLPMNPRMSLLSPTECSYGRKRGMSTSACLPRYYAVPSPSIPASLFQSTQNLQCSYGSKFPLTRRAQCSKMIKGTELFSSISSSNKNWSSYMLVLKRGIRHL